MRLSEMCSICICRAKLLALGCTTVTALGRTNDEPLIGRGREHSIGPSVTACGQLACSCRSSPIIFAKAYRAGPELDY